MRFGELHSKLSYQSLLLGGVTLLTSSVLVLANYLTEKDIQASEKRDLTQSLTQVLPIRYENDLLQDILVISRPEGSQLVVYRARQNGQIEAVVFQVSERGYSGPILLTLGISRQGELLGVRVVKHSETPGLGDKIEVTKSDWILGFNGKSLENLSVTQWQVKKDGGVFDQFTGATITPRAVVRAVKRGLELFATYRNKLLEK